MMKKKILLMCMALMSAMTLWAGHVFLEPDPWDPIMMHGPASVNNLDPAPGDIVTINVAPDPGYRLFIQDIVVIEVDEYDNVVDTLTVTGPPETELPENYTFEMPLNPSHDVHVSVTFTAFDYPVDCDMPAGGGVCEVMLVNGLPLDTLVFPDPQHIIAYTDDVITLKVTPDPGWQLDFIMMDGGTSIVNPITYEFIMPPQPVHLEAFFRQASYTISINNNDPNGTIEVIDIAGVNIPSGTPPPYIAYFGDPIALNSNPNPGYILDYIDIVANDTAYSRTLVNGEMDFDMLPCDITLIPKFKPADITIEVDQGTVDGSIYVRVGGTSYPGVQYVTTHMGRSVRLFNTPDQGYELDQYYVTLKSDGSDVPLNDAGGYNPWFNMPASDVFVTATFKPKAYTLLVDPSMVTVVDINGVPMTPTPNGPYLEYYPVYTGDMIQVVDNLLGNGYNIQNYILDDTDSGTFITSYPGSPTTSTTFPMPPNNVTLTATGTPIQYTLSVERDHSPEGYLNVTVVDGYGVPVIPTPGGPGGRWDYFTVDVTCIITATHNPCPGFFHTETILDDVNGNSFFARYTSDFSLNMPPFDLQIVSDWAQIVYGLQVQPSSYGTAQALVNSTTIITSSGPVYYRDYIQLSSQPIPGYELVRYDLYDAAYPYPQLTGLWNNPPDNDEFYMPPCGVIVVPVFKLKDYTITIDPDIWGGYITATNLDDPYLQWASFVRPLQGVHIGDRIKMTNVVGQNPNFPYGPVINPNGSFSYYIVQYTQGGGLIGQTDHYKLTMSPFDLTFSALFHDTPNGPGPDPNYMIENWVNVTSRGVVLLHQLPPVKKLSNSNEWDEPENYGWASAVQGQPMYFTVAPNLGYQVKKSDITVRLAEVTEDEEDQILSELIVAEGLDISGPDDYISGPTDFSFIYDVPEGVDTCSFHVVIDVNFSAIDYTIAVEDGIEHGTIEVQATANVEDTVAITVTPDPGYRLKDIIVTPEVPGFIVRVDQNNQFVMPASNVTITATFEEDNTLLGDVNGDNDVSIADVSLLIDYLLGNDNGIDLNAADCNLDGNVSVADVTRLIDYLLSGGW